MTQLRMKMVSDMRLRGLSNRTQVQYVRSVRLFAAFHGRSPAVLGTPEVREYLLKVHSAGRAPATVRAYRAALRFVYTTTLGRPEVMADVPCPRQRHSEPGPALSRDEVRRILDAAVRPFDRALFGTLYGCGLRMLEGCALRVEDIDARAGLLHVRHGKGDKSRSVRLSPRVLSMLRKHWRRHHLPLPWLFPARRLSGPACLDIRHPWSGHPVHRSTVHKHFREACRRAGLKRRATLHDLRRAYGTHLLEQGVHLRTIQVLLGHSRPETTMRYTAVSADLIARTPCPLELLE